MLHGGASLAAEPRRDRPTRCSTRSGGNRRGWASASPIARSGAAIDAVANVPYGWRAEDTAPGLFRLGDQGACIPSLAGEGMGIAIESGLRAATAYLRGGPDAAIAYQQRLTADLARPFAIAGAIRAAAERPAWASALTCGGAPRAATRRNRRAPDPDQAHAA